MLYGLAVCTAITLRMYAQRKEWDIGTLRIWLHLQQTRDKAIIVERHIYSDAP